MPLMLRASHFEYAATTGVDRRPALVSNEAAMAIFDCIRCGACCVNTPDNRAEGFEDYVEVKKHDGLMRRKDLLAVYARRNEHGQVHLRLEPDGRCAALVGRVAESVHCAIYASRPHVCRRVLAGSEECLAARRAQGVA
jgi:Fe-S-cluster containining protein